MIPAFPKRRAYELGRTVRTTPREKPLENRFSACSGAPIDLVDPIPVTTTGAIPQLRFRYALALTAMLGLAACSSKISTHGNLVDPDALAKVEPGRSDQGTVLSLLGSPSTRGNFGEPTW